MSLDRSAFSRRSSSPERAASRNFADFVWAHPGFWTLSKPDTWLVSQKNATAIMVKVFKITPLKSCVAFFSMIDIMKRGPTHSISSKLHAVKHVGVKIEIALQMSWSAADRG